MKWLVCDVLLVLQTSWTRRTCVTNEGNTRLTVFALVTGSLQAVHLFKPCQSLSKMFIFLTDCDKSFSNLALRVESESRQYPQVDDLLYSHPAPFFLSMYWYCKEK